MRLRSWLISSVEPELALGVAVERPPEQAVEHHDEERHHARCRARCGGNRRRRSPRRCRRRGRGPRAGVAPARHFGHDAGVPGAARGGDRAGDVVGKIAGQDDARHHSQPLHAGRSSAASRRSVGKALAPAMTLNRMYHWVPSTISGDSQMSGSSCKAHDADDGEREQQVGRESRQELRHRLHRCGNAGPAARSRPRSAPRSGSPARSAPSRAAWSAQAGTCPPRPDRRARACARDVADDRPQAPRQRRARSRSHTRCRRRELERAAHAVARSRARATLRSRYAAAIPARCGSARLRRAGACGGQGRRPRISGARCAAVASKRNLSAQATSGPEEQLVVEQDHDQHGERRPGRRRRDRAARSPARCRSRCRAARPWCRRP